MHRMTLYPTYFTCLYNMTYRPTNQMNFKLEAYWWIHFYPIEFLSDKRTVISNQRLARTEQKQTKEITFLLNMKRRYGNAVTLMYTNLTYSQKCPVKQSSSYKQCSSLLPHLIQIVVNSFVNHFLPFISFQFWES